MFRVFYHSMTGGWRVGLTDSVKGTKVVLHDGAIKETVAKSDVYIPDKDAELLLSMAENPSIFLQQRDAALMSPSPLVAPPSFIELLRYRVAENEVETDIGDNFTLIIGEGSLTELCPPGYEMALRASLAWRASGQRQAIVCSGYTLPSVYDGLIKSSAQLLGATTDQLRIIEAGMRVLSPFTTTIDNSRLCYAQGHVCADSYGKNVTAVRLDCDHLFTSGIDQPNNFNFKIFAYMLYGFSGEEREKFLISRKQQDFVCQTSLRDASLLERLRSEYAAFNEAIDTLGIPSSDLDALLNRVAAIVHLTEVEFYEDGSSSNLPALKSAAGLLELDFQQCLHVFTTRGACVVAAQLLYDATVAMLVRRVNAAMQFISGEPPASSLCVLLAPPPPPAESDDLEHLATAIMYEDIAQTYVRASDREIVQWQRAGFCVSPDLSAAFDGLDNYSVLKVLRGLGGILSIAQSPDQRAESLRVALASCARHASVRLDAATLSLTVAHSFGARRYQFPRGAHAAAPSYAGSAASNGDVPASASVFSGAARKRTAGHGDHAAVAALLRDGADAGTRECLRLLAQRDGEMPATALAHEAQRARRFLAALQDEAAALWWLHREKAPPQEMPPALHVRAAVQLRRFVPRRLLAVQPERLARIKGADAGNDAGENGDAKLIDGAALARMHRAACDAVGDAICLVQAFARQRAAALTFCRRRAEIAAALTAAVRAADLAVEQYRSRAISFTVRPALSGAALAALLRDEAAARARLRDEAWAAVACIEERARSAAAAALSAALAAASSRGSAARTNTNTNTKSPRGRLTVMDAFVARRLAAHRARLDGAVAAAVRSTARQSERAAAAETRRAAAADGAAEKSRAAAEAHRRRMESSARAVRVREAERNARSEQREARVERSRAARERKEAAQEEAENARRAQLAVADMEARAVQRVRNEAAAYCRQQSAATALRNEEERKRRQAERTAQEKALWAREQRAARHAAMENARSMAQQADKRKTYSPNTSAVNASKKRNSDSFARALRRAESEFANPQLFEQRTDGSLSTRHCTLYRTVSESFVLSSGRKTYARTITENSMRGLFALHAAKARAKSPYPSAAGVR